MTFNITELDIKLFADGADIKVMEEMANKSYISGLTTNPTLMRKAGITNYEKFAKQVLEIVRTKPISFEIFSDDLEVMKYQGEKIAAFGENVFVKVPITNTKGISTSTVISYLSTRGIKLNVTAVMTVNQVEKIAQVIDPKTPSFVSVFAGRIADTGRDPIPLIQQSLKTLENLPSCELIWASPRELLNIFQANDAKCHIITATNELLNKLELIGKDLSLYSLETVKMFYNDAASSGYVID
jgi:transaldolase